MNRRDFIRFAGMSGAVAATLPACFNLHAAPFPFNGKFVITIQAEGGWDVTSFCDPKINIAGEDKINNWADAGEVQTAGNIAYAPVGNNQSFFEKYHRDTLIINGIDAQTNSHSAGVVHNWSGRISEGYPSLTALYAAAYAPELPISYINNGGYSQTADLIRYSRMDDVGNLNNIVFPNNLQWDDKYRYLHQDDFSLVNQFRAERLARQTAKGSLSVRELNARHNYQSAITNSSLLSDLASNIKSAGELQAWEEGPHTGSSLKRQLQLALLSMKSGVSVAADVIQWGYDSHDDNDARQAWLFDNLTSSIDYLWEYAEQLGVADRLLVVVMSDFGRTPRYNDTAGKDHWPISSAMIMERDVSWTNQTIGFTDEGHNALSINSATLKQDQQAGTIIYPKHVMQGLRDYLNLSQQTIAQPFSLNSSESFAFFS